jgi:hypothetical protein
METATLETGYSLPFVGGSDSDNDSEDSSLSSESKDNQMSFQNEMALRGIKAALKHNLSTYNKMSGGLVNKIIDRVIPLPPSKFDALIDGSSSNPLSFMKGENSGEKKSDAASTAVAGATGALNSMMHSSKD